MTKSATLNYGSVRIIHVKEVESRLFVLRFDHFIKILLKTLAINISLVNQCNVSHSKLFWCTAMYLDDLHFLVRTVIIVVRCVSVFSTCLMHWRLFLIKLIYAIYLLFYQVNKCWHLIDSSKIFLIYSWHLNTVFARIDTYLSYSSLQ